MCSEAADKYRKWKCTADKLAEIKIPRFVTLQADGVQREIHTFCDASSKAYAAVVFMRSELHGEFKISLLASKTRVAPIKKKTIPRLELLGCAIGVRLTNSVVTAYGRKFPTHYWSDSTTALAWIRRNCEWGTFVGNRVKEICKFSNSDDWHFVPGTKNPADLPSRGCTTEQLLASRWWEGPNWLINKKTDWTREEEDEDLIQQEIKKKIVKLLTLTETPWYISKFSSYSSNVRVMGWIRRFVINCKEKVKQPGELTVAEVNEAERTLFKLVQEEQFSSKANEINGIRVVHEEDGLIRVASKLLHRQDSEEFRLPVLLPSKHVLIQQLILEEHVRSKHAGAQFLMAKLREKCWILQGRKSIKQVIGKCVICKRFSSKPLTVPTAALPEHRVKNARV